MSEELIFRSSHSSLFVPLTPVTTREPPLVVPLSDCYFSLPSGTHPTLPALCGPTLVSSEIFGVCLQPLSMVPETKSDI